MKPTYACLFLLCAIHLTAVENAKIFSVHPLPTKSHYIMFKRLFEELASRGHDIDILTSFIDDKNISGINYIPYPIITPLQMQFTIQELREITTQQILDLILSGRAFGHTSTLCSTIFEPEIMKTMRDTKKKYDLVIGEEFVSECLFGFAYKFNVPLVTMTTSVDLPWGSQRLGNPDNPAYIPLYFSTYISEMSLYERVMNTIAMIHAKLVFYGYLQTQQRTAREFFGDDLPCLDDIARNSSLLLVNSHFSANQARPNVPNVIEVAGLHIENPKPVQKNIQDFIGDSKFIYFSLGSIVRAETLPIETLQMFCNVFKKFSHIKVIWKADATKFPKELVVPKNIYTGKWMSQLDVLCHPNISFFITHSGLMGTQEAVYCGVPMMGIPNFADQYVNTNNMVHRGLAIEIDLEKVTEEDLYLSMKQLAENPKYKNNAKRLSEQFRDRPRSPLDEAVYWIEYVLRHKGAPQLRSRAADLSWYQYYLLDVVLVIVSSIALLSTVIYVTIKYIFMVISSLRKCKKEKSA